MVAYGLLSSATFLIVMKVADPFRELACMPARGDLILIAFALLFHEILQELVALMLQPLSAEAFLVRLAFIQASGCDSAGGASLS